MTAAALALLLIGYSTATSLLLERDRWYVPRNAALAAALTVAALASGVSPTRLGLAAGAVGGGWWWGGAAAALAALALGGALAVADRLPAVGRLLEDRRAAVPARALAWHTLVRIPVGTALFEEVAFRGVLLALLRRSLSDPVAVLASSLAFGLWHVGPTLATLTINEVASRRVTWVTLAVVATSVGGAALAGLRLVSGSLLAPVLAHWAVNAAAMLASASRRRRRPDPV